MDNFDLKKYLAEGRLLKEVMDGEKEFLQPILNVLKSKKYVSNLDGYSGDGDYQDADWPQAYLYWNTELPKEDGSKGKMNQTQGYARWMGAEPRPDKTGKDYDVAFSPGRGGFRFYAKDKNVLYDLIDAMPQGDWSDIKNLENNFVSGGAAGFKPVKYFRITLDPTKK
jgi:hypothetical protein